MLKLMKLGAISAKTLQRRTAIIKKTTANQDRFPLYYAKKKGDQGGQPGRVMNAICRGKHGVLRQIDMTSPFAQTLTGHGGFAQYLFRFKLKDPTYCARDPTKIQDVMHGTRDM
ncbi:hypothetical protein EVAR_41696_1 [Eumeta japonica]|uniref:Uncharacterized protein n=1 Tax=Eumeta variegata TaxID=151549 RepID=A0A4C1VNC5_EUMVA|nr:hypothetical protein EVAR_41696_1 [Eumeta japonica]